MDTATKIEVEAAAARQLLASIVETIGDDEQAAIDAVEGETNLLEALDRALARMGELDALRIGLEAYAKTLHDRIARLEAADGRLRAAMYSALNATGLRKVERPLATLSLRPGQSAVVIEAEHMIPAWHKRWKGWEIDKTSIRASIKAGTAVPGARLSEAGTTLQVRV